MKKEQADMFVSEGLQGIWPDWNPTNEEMFLWREILYPCDYEIARQDVRNWFVGQDIIYRRPPVGKLRKVLAKSRQVCQKRQYSEPVLLYTLLKETEGQLAKRGQKFFAANEDEVPSDSYSIEKAAEKMRNEFEYMYGGKYIVIRDWQRLEQFAE